MGTCTGPAGFSPITPLTSKPMAFSRRELNHFLVLPRTTSSEADNIRDSLNVTAGEEWIISGNAALRVALRIPRWQPLCGRRRYGFYWL